MNDSRLTSTMLRAALGQEVLLGWQSLPAGDLMLGPRGLHLDDGPALPGTPKRHNGDAQASWASLSAAGVETQRAHQLLAASLDGLNVGLEIWDEQDRLTLYNKTVNQMHANFHTPAHLGQTFETLQHINLQRRLIISAVGREEAWLAERMATRARHPAPLLQEFAGDRWVHIYETRTAEGYVLAARVDVTDLVRREKMLEVSNQLLARQSVTDDLTGQANRRRFDEALATEWLRAARSGAPLSLLMVDIDHFKNYNDRYGHLAGDQCLRRVATALGQCVRRAGELVARYGGEEFVMLLPNADITHACESAQNCLDRMQEEALPHAASSTANRVTLSIGVASTRPDATMEAATLVNAADAAMYRAKSSGRARYEFADACDWSIDEDTPRTQPAPLA
jgi:diguanylate cyclase (GGDEF)-like protein